MGFGDWLHAAANLLIGVLLGIAAAGLVELATSALWPLAILIPLLFAGLFLFEWVLDKGVDRFFPEGIRPAKTPTTSKRKPWIRLSSLPLGLLVGVILARLGLSVPLPGLLP